MSPKFNFTCFFFDVGKEDKDEDKTVLTVELTVGGSGRLEEVMVNLFLLTIKWEKIEK